MYIDYIQFFVLISSSGHNITLQVFVQAIWRYISLAASHTDNEENAPTVQLLSILLFPYLAESVSSISISLFFTMYLHIYYYNVNLYRVVLRCLLYYMYIYYSFISRYTLSLPLSLRTYRSLCE